MIPKQPPKRTATRPGLGIDEALKRLDSAELRRVRDRFEQDAGADGSRDSKPDGVITPPPSSRARVPREDDDVPPDSVPRSDRFATAPRREPHPATRPRPPGSPPIARQQTAVGLGSKTHPLSYTSQRPAEEPMPSSRRGGSDPVPASKPSRAWADEPPTSARARKPLTIDAVGDAATRIARTHQTAPKVIATQAIIASAPLDSRTAFVLSLVDGTTDVPAIVDATGMPSDEVIGILARLARLGLISVP